MIWIALLIIALAALSRWPRRWLVRDGQRYLLRWPLLGGDGLKRAPWFLGREGSNLFLHLIVQSDGPCVHSHPWSARSLILWGRYVDTRQYRLIDGWIYGEGEYGPGSINEIDAGCFHTLTLRTKWCLTLCWTGKKHGRGWGFLVNGKVVNASGRGAAAYDEAQQAGR